MGTTWVSQPCLQMEEQGKSNYNYFIQLIATVKSFIVQAQVLLCLHRSEIKSRTFQVFSGQCYKTFLSVIYGFL
jgi:hypothetical protein